METRRARSPREKRSKARSLASIRKPRIGGAFVMRLQRCEARTSASLRTAFRQANEALLYTILPRMRVISSKEKARNVSEPTGIVNPTTGWVLCPRTSKASDVVIEKELVGMWTEPDLVDLARALVAKIGLDHVLGENVPLQEELVITFKRVERLVERSGRLRNLRHLLRGQVVEILVDRIARTDTPLNPVEAGHQHRCEAEIRICRRIRAAELHAFRLGVG